MLGSTAVAEHWSLQAGLGWLPGSPHRAGRVGLSSRGGWIPILPISQNAFWDAGLLGCVPLFLTHCGLLHYLTFFCGGVYGWEVRGGAVRNGLLSMAGPARLTQTWGRSIYSANMMP